MPALCQWWWNSKIYLPIKIRLPNDCPIDQAGFFGLIRYFFFTATFLRKVLSHQLDFIFRTQGGHVIFKVEVDIEAWLFHYISIFTRYFIIRAIYWDSNLMAKFLPFPSLFCGAAYNAIRKLGEETKYFIIWVSHTFILFIHRSVTSDFLSSPCGGKIDNNICLPFILGDNISAFRNMKSDCYPWSLACVY